LCEERDYTIENQGPGRGIKRDEDLLAPARCAWFRRRCVCCG
jgi:hypothetical protein